MGGVVGASLGISASALIFLFFMKRRSSQQGPPPAPVFDAITQPRMGEHRPPPLGDRALVSSYLPEAPAPPLRPVRHYVRISTLLSQSVHVSHVFPLFYMRRTRSTQPRSPGTKEPILCQRSTPRCPARMASLPTRKLHNYHRHTMTSPLFYIATLVLNHGRIWLLSLVFVSRVVDVGSSDVFGGRSR